MKVDKQTYIGANTIADAHICKKCIIEVEIGEATKDLMKEVYKCFDEHILDIIVKVSGKDDKILKVHRPGDWEENREKYIRKLNEQFN